MVERECPMFADSATRAACVTSIRHEGDTLFEHVRSRTNELLVALRSLLGRLSASSEPKTVVLISEGLVLPEQRTDVAWVGPLASAAHVSLYVLRLDNTPFDASMRRVSASLGDDRALEIEGLELLAGLARGAIFPVVSNPESAFDRLAAELSGYYLLSFEPEGSDRDGKPHSIDVKVGRSAVEVRARREFAVDTSRAALTEEDLLAETLRSPLLASEVPVKVTTYTFRDVASGKLKVMIAADIDRSAGAPGDLALGYALVDSTGKLAASELQKHLSPSSPDATSQMYMGAALVDPGIYTLKLAVLDAEGKRGSVEHSFRAQLQSAGQLRFGELLLADVRRGATARDVRPLVDTNVTADSIHPYLEMYSDAAAQLEGATATLEVAADVNGRALESGTLRLQDVEDGKRRAGEGSVPVALLPPGGYVARAVVSVGGRPVGRVVRPFSISRALPAAPAGEAPGAAAGGATPAIALAATIGPFRRESALQPPIVSFFIERMYTADTAASASALKPIADEARAGRFDAVTVALDRLDQKVAAERAPTFLRGLTLLARGDLEAAAGKFRESIRLDSEFLPGAFYLGACYAAGGRDREAVGAWQTSLITEHEAPFVYTMLGDALLRLSDGRQALDILGEASTLWPDNDEVRMRLGMAFAMMGDGRQALATLDPYLGRHPDDHERFYLALRLLYETAAAGRFVGTPDDDRARFARYATAYAAANGPQQALVEEWGKFIEKKKSRQ